MEYNIKFKWRIAKGNIILTSHQTKVLALPDRRKERWGKGMLLRGFPLSKPLASWSRCWSQLHEQPSHLDFDLHNIPSTPSDCRANLFGNWGASEGSKPTDRWKMSPIRSDRWASRCRQKTRTLQGADKIRRRIQNSVIQNVHTSSFTISQYGYTPGTYKQADT